MGAVHAEVGHAPAPCCRPAGVPGPAIGGGGGAAEPASSSGLLRDVAAGLRREGGGGGVRSADARRDVGGDLVVGDLVAADLAEEGVLVAVDAFKGIS